MAIAEVRDLEKAYAGRSVLRGVSFDLQKGQKIGLVGPNGAGKTTLLKILAGIEAPDHGSAGIARAVKWSYVSQVPMLDPEETLRHQVAIVFDEVHDIERQMHEAADLLARHASGPEHDRAMERYGQLEAQFQHMGGYDVTRRVEAVLDVLAFASRDLDLPIKALSGGQKSRAQIARLLLEAPDLMLLDEPTNHLDLPMLDWLEETLHAMTDATLVVVSHDRYFLDSVVDEIFELRDGTVEKYPGNYSAYMELRAQRLLTQQRSYEQQQAYIAKQEEFIRRFQANQRARQARGRKTRLERLKSESLVARAKTDGRAVVLNLKVTKPSGHDVLKVDGLRKGYPGKPLFTDVELRLPRGTRLGIIGPNGAGKTTLLSALAGEVPPDSGKIKWGHGVALQYYRQEHEDLEPGRSVIDELQKVRITATQQELRDLAALFLFSGDTIEKKTEVLSGGEKARVALAKLLMNPTNTILMDEPTNHLDMATCEVLEDALDSFDGTLILVSHDRYFMDQVCDQLLVLHPERMSAGALTSDKSPTSDNSTSTPADWKLYQGSYTDYLATAARERTAALEAKKETERQERKREQERLEAQRQHERAAAATASKPKLPYKFARMTIGEIETRVGELEQEVAALEGQFGDTQIASNSRLLKELQEKYEQTKRALAEWMGVWEIKAEAED